MQDAIPTETRPAYVFAMRLVYPCCRGLNDILLLNNFVQGRVGRDESAANNPTFKESP